jgi:hypothetical protein
MCGLFSAAGDVAVDGVTYGHDGEDGGGDVAEDVLLEFGGEGGVDVEHKNQKGNYQEDSQQCYFCRPSKLHSNSKQQKSKIQCKN